jgi:hypothetical protein
MRKYYPTEGTDVAKRLSKPFTKRQIQTHAGTLGIKKDSIKWTPQEDALIRKYYPNKEKCLEHIHGRVWTGICKRASVLGLAKEPNRPWTEKEFDFLRKHASTMSNEEIARHLNRTASSVRTKRQRLGIPGIQQNLWTPEEDAILYTYYRTTLWADLLKMLPNRTKENIKQRTSKLGIKRLIVEK